MQPYLRKMSVSVGSLSASQPDSRDRAGLGLHSVRSNRRRCPRVPQEYRFRHHGTSNDCLMLVHIVCVCGCECACLYNVWTVVLCVCFGCCQDLNTTRYHIVLSDRLMKVDLLGGAYKETMLGFSYQLGILPRDDKVLLLWDALGILLVFY